MADRRRDPERLASLTPRSGSGLLLQSRYCSPRAVGATAP